MGFFTDLLGTTQPSFTVPGTVIAAAAKFTTGAAAGKVLTSDADGDATWGTMAGGTKDITQATHGFAVQDVLYHNGTIYAKAKADASATAEVIGIVSAINGADDFTLSTGGYVSGLSGLTAGAVYYLSPTTAGALTATEPSAVGHVSKPILIAVSTTAGYFFNMRGVISDTGLSPFDQFLNVADSPTFAGLTVVGAAYVGSFIATGNPGFFAVQSADVNPAANTDLGFIEAWKKRSDAGSDISAKILFSADGTTGNGDAPGRISFWTTPDGSATLAERMRICSNGAVGIGTSAPSGSTTSKSIQIGLRGTFSNRNSDGATSFGQNTYEDTDWKYVVTGTALLFHLAAAGDFHLYTAPSGNAGANATLTSRFTVLNTGKVGIGHTAPVGQLDFGQGDGIFVSAANINTIGVASGQNADYGLWINYNGYADGATQFRNLTIGNGKHVAIAYFQGSTGNVGIGTTAPGSNLTVYSATSGTTIDIDTHVSSYGEATLHFGYGLSASYGNRIVGANTPSNTYGGSLYFQYGTGSGWGTGILMTNAGRVTIGGSTGPTSTLQVMGLPSYTSDAAARTGGLSVGAFYLHPNGAVNDVCVVG